MKIKKKNFSEWNNKNAFRRKFGTKLPKSYPDETLVRILNSRSYSKLTSNIINKKNAKVCDIGCMSGNNLRFFIDKGFKPYGVDVNKAMLEIGKKNLKRMKYKIPNLKIGNNLNIPFKNSFFDLLISFGTIHYNYGNNVLKSLMEFRRVVKKSGIVIIETTGNKHDLKKNAIRKGNLEWICKVKGFRKNKIFGWFDSKSHFKKSLKKIFKEVEILENINSTQKTVIHSIMAICKV
tara:strand:- start:660 stop:1364 length:705 start_codon:yes stop_codon:yes gene_type:complete